MQEASVVLFLQGQYWNWRVQNWGHSRSNKLSSLCWRITTLNGKNIGLHLILCWNKPLTRLVESILNVCISKEEYKKIQKDLHQLTSCLMDIYTSLVTTHWMGAAVCPNRATSQIFQSGSLTRLVQTIMGHNFQLSNWVPVELRMYNKEGAGVQILIIIIMRAGF